MAFIVKSNLLLINHTIIVKVCNNNLKICDFNQIIIKNIYLTWNCKFKMLVLVSYKCVSNWP